MKSTKFKISSVLVSFFAIMTPLENFFANCSVIVESSDINGNGIQHFFKHVGNTMSNLE